ncbi:hypothetical protein LTR62_006354 [Meristemomyces frigidus]|uniref:Uncharacterized protein n=1 Tax=Meristemomyces frigidus TaxID=1508187 RepID=A0AAN7TCE8_9PEZI|nr:hypothetical protein LTR62_006354 [Meristemomyces frigidus]
MASPGTSRKHQIPDINMSNVANVLAVQAGLLDTFYVETDLICPRSPFFETARTRRWRSGRKQRPIYLPHVKPATFSAYLMLLQELQFRIPDEAGEAFPHLAHIYFLADKVGDLISTNLVIDQFISLVKETALVPNSTCVDLIYGNTVPSSPLRHLIVDYMVFDADEDCLNDESAHDFPPLFLRDIILGQRRLRDEWARSSDNALFWTGPAKKARLEKCYYHQHSAQFPACATAAEIMDVQEDGLVDAEENKMNDRCRIV